jgi:hypothetical protein
MKVEKQIPKPTTKAGARRAELIERFWPGAASDLWHRTTEDGYTTVPRTLGLIMSLIENLGDGRDASRVYFDLWCRQFDDSLVELTDEEEFAFSCGYETAGRGVRTWRERMDVLCKLGFIRNQPVGNRKFGYILLRHPHLVVQELRQAGKISESWWGAFMKRIAEVGTSMPSIAGDVSASSLRSASTRGIMLLDD